MVLSGCASRPELPPTVGEVIGAEAWGFDGKLGIRTEHENANLGVQWDQSGEQYRIDLSGPLGLTVARIQGDDTGVTLETRDGKYSARDPETLMAMTLGYEIPVSPMRYWVRGLPSPDAPFRRTEDGLRQLGWQISWTEWQSDRPARMTFSLPDATLRLVVRQWYR